MYRVVDDCVGERRDFMRGAGGFFFARCGDSSENGIGIPDFKNKQRKLPKSSYVPRIANVS